MSSKVVEAIHNGFLPAGPCPGLAVEVPLRGRVAATGLTKREAIAALALQGMLAACQGPMTPALIGVEITAGSVAWADLLLDQLALIPANSEGEKD